MKFNITLIGLFVASICLSGFFFTQWRQSEKDNQRNQANFVSLASEIHNFQKQAVTISILDMKLGEVKKSFPELENSIKEEFNVKLRNVMQISNTQTIVDHTFKTTIKDSVKLDTIPVKLIAYKDAWIDFKATQYQNDFIVERNRVPVPLDQIIYREAWKPKFILPWLWGKRQIYQDVKTKNPYAIIDFTRTINIHK
jgi:hypothetical protein